MVRLDCQGGSYLVNLTMSNLYIYCFRHAKYANKLQVYDGGSLDSIYDLNDNDSEGNVTKYF